MSAYTLTWEQARQAIYTYFVAGWANQLQYFLEGQTPDMTTQSQPFLTFEVTPTRTEQSAMRGGNPPKRSHGQIVATVFVPDGTGAKVRLEAIDKLTNMFCAKTVDLVTYRDTAVLGIVEGKGWRSQTLLAPLYFEHTT